MPVEIVMPRLGWTMEEGTVVEWLKHDGDTVKVGDVIFTVESDKALNEVESFEEGILRIPPDSPPPGQKVPVGGLLAYLVKPGETAPFEAGGPRMAVPVKQASTGSTVARQPQAVADNHRSTHNGEPAISPRARRIAAELGVEWQALQGSGRTGRIIEKDIRAAAELAEKELAAKAGSPVRATPLARKVAEQLGVNLEVVAIQSPGKRIERADVERAAIQAQPMQPGQGVSKIPVSSTRRLIAERMATSAHTTAPVTLTTEADATELVRLRKQLKDDPAAATKAIPSYTDLLAKLTAQALAEQPALNARFDESEGMVLFSESVHIGLAVDTERGLLVPVIRDVERKSIRQIAQESADLVDRARTARLSPDQLQGGTFTITNLGMYDIDAFTPIINLPECAVLGVGRIVPKPVVVDPDTERVAVRHMLFLSLTFDHRLVDGAPAARFLQRIKQFVERPYLWLVS